MKLCNIKLDGMALLAPMAGVADNAFRQIARQQGAAMTFSELISADGLVRDSYKTYELLKFDDSEQPYGIQIFGSDPQIMAKAAKIAEKAGPDLIDLNFGCPVKRVVKRGAGAAVMNDLPRMREIVREVRSQISLPLTAKIRSGWDDRHIKAVQSAKIIQEEGACAVTVHARTKKMAFKGEADWNIISEVKKAVEIPVIGNGDIFTPEDGVRMLKETGCDFLMIGRGAMGKPWLFSQINELVETGAYTPDPSFEERMEILIQHYELALKWMETERAVFEMRKQVGWYLKGMRNNHQVRREVFEMEDPEEVIHRIRQYIQTLT